MIELKELTNRKYDGKLPISFEYEIDIKSNVDSMKNATVFFERNEEDTNTWEAYMLVRLSDGTSQVLTVEYTLPVEQELNKVCATGLFMLQMLIKEYTQNYSLIDFLIGDKIRDM